MLTDAEKQELVNAAAEHCREKYGVPIDAVVLGAFLDGVQWLATRMVVEGVTLRAVGDHVERVYPEAASGTDEDYGSPILPPAHADRTPLPGQPSEP